MGRALWPSTPRLTQAGDEGSGAVQDGQEEGAARRDDPARQEARPLAGLAKFKVGTFLVRMLVRLLAVRFFGAGLERVNAARMRLGGWECGHCRVETFMPTRPWTQPHARQCACA